MSAAAHMAMFKCDVHGTLISVIESTDMSADYIMTRRLMDQKSLRNTPDVATEWRPMNDRLYSSKASLKRI